MSDLREALAELVACKDAHAPHIADNRPGYRWYNAWAAASAALAATAAQAQGAEPYSMLEELPDAMQLAARLRKEADALDATVLGPKVAPEPPATLAATAAPPIVYVQAPGEPVTWVAPAALQDRLREDDDYSVPALVHWLRAKYARHGEIEDKLAADALGRLMAERDGARRALADAAAELPHVAGPINNRIRVYRASSQAQADALRVVVKAADAMRRGECYARGPLVDAYDRARAELDAGPRPPYPEFCHTPAKCAGLGSCPRDPCCAD